MLADVCCELTRKITGTFRYFNLSKSHFLRKIRANRELQDDFRLGIPRPAFLAYNLSNSQWYIQWLRTLRNRGAERVPIKDRKPVGWSTPTGFFHGVLHAGCGALKQ